MNIRLITAVYIACLLVLATNPAYAHFGMVIPSQNIVTQEKNTVGITLSFSHPFEQTGMKLEKPVKFYVLKDGKKTDLLDSLQETSVMDHTGWQTSFKANRPGIYQFIMEPKPYWEPFEDLSIIHYTKTILPAFGGEVGWDEPVGLPTEIVPYTRPFGNYAGNSFIGEVLVNGKPSPFAEVEVEYFNQKALYRAPTDYHVTQVVKADERGVFLFTCPNQGWWGFAALSEANYTIKNPKGEEKGVELGAVLWIYFDKYLED